MRASFLLSTSLIFLGSSGMLSLPGITCDAAYATSTATTTVVQTPEEQLAALKAQRASATARPVIVVLDRKIERLERQIEAGTAASVTVPSVSSAPVVTPSTPPATSTVSAPPSTVVKTPEQQLEELRDAFSGEASRARRIVLGKKIEQLEGRIASTSTPATSPAPATTPDAVSTAPSSPTPPRATSPAPATTPPTSPRGPTTAPVDTSATPATPSSTTPPAPPTTPLATTPAPVTTPDTTTTAPSSTTSPASPTSPRASTPPPVTTSSDGSTSANMTPAPEPATPTHTQSETHLPAPTPEATRPTQSLSDLPRGTNAPLPEDSLNAFKKRPAQAAGARRLPTRAGRRVTQSALEENRAAQYEEQVTSLETLARVLPDASQAAATSQEPSQEELRQVRESVANVEKVSSSLSSSQHSRLAAVKEKLENYDAAHAQASSTSSSTSAPSESAASTSSPVPKPKSPLLQEIEGGKELSNTQDRDAQRAVARAQRISKVRERMGELGTLAPEGKEALKKEVRTLLSTASDSERAELEGMQKTLNPAPARVQRPGSSTSSSSSTQRPVGSLGMPSFDPSKVQLRTTPQAPALSGDPSKSVNPSELEATLQRRADGPSSSTTTTSNMTQSLLLSGPHGGTPGLPLPQPDAGTTPARPGFVIKKVTPESMLEKVSAAKGQPIEKKRDVLKEVSNYLQRPALSTQDKERVEAAYNALKEEVDPTPKLVIRPALPRSSSSRTPGTDTSAGSSNQIPSPHPAPSVPGSSSQTPAPSSVHGVGFSTSPVDGVDTSVALGEELVAPGSAMFQVLSSSAETFTGYRSRVSTPGGTQPRSIDRQPFLTRSLYIPGHGGLLPITLFPGSRVSTVMGSVYGDLTQMQPSTPRFMPSDDVNGITDLDATSAASVVSAPVSTTPAAPSENIQPLSVSVPVRPGREGQTEGGTTSLGERFLGGLRSLASNWGIGSRQASQGDALTPQGRTPSVPGAARGSSSFRPGDDSQGI